MRHQYYVSIAFCLGIFAVGVLSVTSTAQAQESGMDADALPPHPPKERMVGIAYQTWFPPISWDNVWGTPELGHYRSENPEVIRQHAAWLYDAGVDFIWIDWSNNVDHDPTLPPGEPILDEDGNRFLANRPDIRAIETSTEILFEEYTQLEEHPKIAIFAGSQPAASATDGRLQKKADQIYETFIANPEYRDMYVTYLGKPLLVVYVGTPSPWQTGVPDWDDPRFTVRWMTGFVTEQAPLRTDDLISRHGYWSWEDRGAQTYPVHEGQPESMVVVASWRRQGEPGDPNYIPAQGRRDGETFREQWARAREIGPKFAMVVSWNEWTLGEAISAEISKDIEPSEEHGHFYLDLMKTEIAKFKRTETEVHSGDRSGNGRIDLADLLHIVTLYNAGAYHCALEEDAPYYCPGPGDSDCAPHSSDYNPTDWRIDISELLRAVQLYKAEGYTMAPDTEDGFAPTIAEAQKSANQ